ncbi:MAG: glycosyltransferase family 2 protein [Bacteroidetes bacterium]|nr:glycosyltransferase family 2 protein [Bacteroidota bacterium]MCH8523252.1 glycosyltransferase family 2 protein [Balneolales bacterium]
MQGFSIIIVTWNALHHLQRFLPSVVQTQYHEYEIIISDNASTDGSADWVRSEYPEIKIVTHEENYGYCGGNNRAVDAAHYNTLVFLNNDVAVEPDWLQHVAKLMADNPLIDAVQPRIRSYENPEQFEYAGAAGGFIDKLGYPYCRGRIFDTVESDNNQYDKATPIFWASGAALVIKKTIFTTLGGFEESFEFHMEEIDLCWRLQLRGRQVWYCPNSVVYHLGGGSLSADNPRKVYYNFRNNLLMLVRNHPSRHLFRNMLLRLLLDDVATIRFLTRGKFTHALAVIKAFFGFLRRLPKAMHYRRGNDVNSSILVEPSNYSILWQYFVRKKGNYNDLPGHDYVHSR